MTPKGFECLLYTHGVNIHNKIAGFCREDKDASEPRIEQIKDWLLENDSGCESWIAIDDMFLDDDKRCFQTDGNVGFTEVDLNKIIKNETYTRTI
jgi:hypothetical protein